MSKFGGNRRRAPRPDPVKQDVERRQRRVAEKLAPLVGTPPSELLDYARYDSILHRR